MHGFLGVVPNLISYDSPRTDSSTTMRYISYLCAFKKFTQSDTITR